MGTQRSRDGQGSERPAVFDAMLASHPTPCILCLRRVVYDIADNYPNFRHRGAHRLEEQLDSTRILALFPRTVYLLRFSDTWYEV